MTVLRSGSATDVGRVRTSNQDLSLEELNLFAVADGMGGHVGGEVAARVAVDALRGAFAHQATVPGLRAAVAEANAAVWRRSQAQVELRGMGTTLTAAALVPGPDGRDLIALANVGDSRAYVYSKGQITQVTADHSLAEEKVRHGELTEAEAAVHPHRHILTRALGVAAAVEVDLWEMQLQGGDRILLCSDGLTNEVGVIEIARILGSVADPHEAARRLVVAANEHGGNDNITAVVVDVVVGEGEQAEGGGAGAPATGAAAGPAVAGAVSGATAGVVGAADSLTGMVPAQPAAGRVASPQPAVDEDRDGDAERKPGRRERNRQRRLAGIPRRLTFRVLLFAVLLVAVVAAAYGIVRWYATDNWYVTVDGNHLVIYQGRPGGMLWFQPTVVERTDVTTKEVLPFRLPTLRADKQEPSLAAARHYVANLHQEYVTQQMIANGQSTTTTTTTTTTTATTTTTTTGPTATTTTTTLAGGF